MARFSWRFNPRYFLKNKDKPLKALRFSIFAEEIALEIQNYEKYELENLMHGDVPHVHLCTDIQRKNTPKAKALVKHIEKLNSEYFQAQGVFIEPCNILQLNLQNVAGFKAFRCFGILINDCFYLVYLDPTHEVYGD